MANDKQMILQDKLFDEILNGFRKEHTKVDKITTVLNQKYKNRLVEVGNYFFINKDNSQFTIDFFERLGYKKDNFIISNSFQKFGGKFGIFDDIYSDDFDDTDEEAVYTTEKDEASIFSIWRALSVYKGYEAMKKLYKAYKKYKQMKQHFQLNFQDVIETVRDRKLSKELKVAKIIEQFTNSIMVTMGGTISYGAENLVALIDKNPIINSFFDKLDELIREAEIKAGIRSGLALLSSGLKALSGATKGVSYVVSLFVDVATWAWATYDAMVLYDKYTNFFGDFDLESATKLRDAVENALSDTNRISEQITEKLYRIEEGVNDIINPQKYIDKQVKRFQENIQEDVGVLTNVVDAIRKQPIKIGNRYMNVRSGRFVEQSNDKMTIPNIGLLGQDIPVFRFEIPEEKSIMESIQVAHQTRYNINVSQESYSGLEDIKNGLYVIRILKQSQENIIKSYSNFGTVFFKYIDDIKNGILNKLDKSIQNLKKYEIDFKYPEDKSDNVPIDDRSDILSPFINDGEQRDDDSHGTFSVDSVSIPKGSNKSTIPDIPREKKLRLSERSLHPIHPIFDRWGLRGIELQLMDKDDNEIGIKISDWMKPEGNVLVQNVGGGKPTQMEKYLIFTNALDLLGNTFQHKMLEIENEINNTANEIIKQIIL